MVFAIWDKIVQSPEKESPCRSETLPMLGMLRVGMMELQVDKSTGELDQPFVKSVIGCLSSILEPEMFQHIMRFVIVLGIEALEITEITGIEI